MQEFRRFVRGPVGKVLLAAIILPFVISGFYGYFTGGGTGDVVAEVEGSKISRNMVNQRVERVRDMLRQQSPNMNPALLDSFVRPEMVLDGLVNEQLILAAADDAGLAFSEAQVAQDIRQISLFQEDGKFSNNRFERELRSRGMTPQSYIRGLRQDMVKEQYRAGFQATNFALPSELEEQRRLGEQVRDIRYVELDLDALRNSFAVTDEEISDYYQANQGEFMRPESFRIAYLSLSAQQYADQVSVTDEEVAQEYQVRKAIMAETATNASRQVAHILISVDGDRDLDDAKVRASEAAKAIAGGMSFAEAAAQYSDDPGSANRGGDLGVVSKGALPEAMEDVIADLPSGVVSAPVVTDAGVHLIKVNEIAEQQEMPSLAELEAQIRSDLEQAKAEALLNEDVVVLEDALYEHSSLETPAELIAADIQTTGWVALSSLPEPLNAPAVQQALNSDQVRRDGHNSDLLETDPGKYLAVRIAEEKPAEPLPLSEVTFAIEERIKADRAADKVQTLMAEAEQKIEQSASLEDLATLFGSEVAQQDGLQRGASEPSLKVVNAAFSQPRAAEGEASTVELVRNDNGSLTAYQVVRVEDGNAEPLTDDQQSAALLELGNIEGQRSFRQVVALLREEGDVDLFPSRLSPNAGTE